MCPSPVSGDAVFGLPAQSSLVFSVAGTVTGLASLDNTATITPGTGGVCSATAGCSANANSSYTPFTPADPPVVMPARAPATVGAGALAALTACFGFMAWRRRAGHLPQTEK